MMKEESDCVTCRRLPYKISPAGVIPPFSAVISYHWSMGIMFDCTISF